MGDMDSDTMEDTMADSDTTARGLLMLRPIPTFFMEDLDMDTLDTPDTSDTMAMDSDTCTARGLLMLRLSLIPTFFGGHLGYGHLGYAGLGHYGYGYGRYF